MSDTTVPHLQRVHPGGEFLASYDAKSSAFVIQRIDGQAGTTRTVELAGTTGAPKQVRWTVDGKSILFATQKSLYIAALDPSGDETLTTARQIPLADDIEIQDVRVMKDGLIVRAELPVEIPGPSEPMEFTPTDLVFGGGGPKVEMSVGHLAVEERLYLDDPESGVRGPGQVYFIPLTNGGAGKAVALLREGERTHAAMPLADGTVAVAVAPYDATDYWDDEAAEHLVIAKPGSDGWTRVSSQECNDDCDASNWAPGADKPIYAIYETVFVDGPGGKVVTFDENVDVLWKHLTTGSLLVGAGQTVAMLTAEGEEKWSWDSGDDTIRVRSAHFSGTGEAVVVATDKEVLRIVEGRTKRILSVKSYSHVEEDDGGDDEDDWSYTTTTKERRLDSVVPLPGGGIAYAILETEMVEESL